MKLKHQMCVGEGNGKQGGREEFYLKNYNNIGLSHSFLVMRQGVVSQLDAVFLWCAASGMYKSLNHRSYRVV